MADEDETGPSDDEVRDALRSLRTDDAKLEDVLTLVAASGAYAVRLLPEAAVDAVMTLWTTQDDVDSGGLDQAAWNQGPELTKLFGAAFTEVGAIENGALFARLAKALEAYRGDITDAQIELDPTTHFLAFRRIVNGPDFGLPDPREELGEPVLEYVLARLDELPDPDGPLPRVDQ